MPSDDAKQFEEKWNDIKIFIEYGMLSDEKFRDQAMKFALLENTDGKFFKLDDYKKLIEANRPTRTATSSTFMPPTRTHNTPILRLQPTAAMTCC